MDRTEKYRTLCTCKKFKQPTTNYKDTMSEVREGESYVREILRGAFLNVHLAYADIVLCRCGWLKSKSIKQLINRTNQIGIKRKLLYLYVITRL